MLPRWFSWIAGLVLLSGCSYPVREQADLAVCDLSAHPLDLQQAVAADQGRRELTPAHYQSPAGPDASSTLGPKSAIDEAPTGTEKKPRPTLPDRLQMPAELPGGKAPPIKLPDDPTERKKAIADLYPPLPAMGSNPQPQPGPEGRPLTLADLQRLALANSPLIRQAASDVEAAKGAAAQAGAYPNPNFGYQSDTAGTGATAGFQGIFFEQVIKTAGKLKLAQAAALMDLLNAQLALRRAQADLAGQVRAAYFAVLVARENVRVSEALARFTDAAFRVQVELVEATLAAPYEPMQLRVQAYQARGALVQARSQSVAAWKQLAATLGLPGMPMTEVAGRVDMAIPIFHYDAVLARVLSTHTDVGTAEAGLQKARYNLRAAQVVPVPDVSLHVTVEKDFTVPPFLITNSIQMGVPVPVWDRNKGGIIQAQGALLRALEEPHRVRDDLTSRLADAYQRYESNRVLLRLYRDQILPDQVRAYQGVRERHNVLPDEVGFGDVVAAQQTLAGVVTAYVTTLGAQWTALVDLTTLLQTNDLFQEGMGAEESQCVTPVADLEHLLSLPCCHPCSAEHAACLKGADGRWPAAIPGQEEELPMPKTMPAARQPARPPIPKEPASRAPSAPSAASPPEAFEVLPLHVSAAPVARPAAQGAGEAVRWRPAAPIYPAPTGRQ